MSFQWIIPDEVTSLHYKYITKFCRLVPPTSMWCHFWILFSFFSSTLRWQEACRGLWAQRPSAPQAPSQGAMIHPRGSEHRTGSPPCRPPHPLLLHAARQEATSAGVPTLCSFLEQLRHTARGINTSERLCDRLYSCLCVCVCVCVCIALMGINIHLMNFTSAFQRLAKKKETLKALKHSYVLC